MKAYEAKGWIMLTDPDGSELNARVEPEDLSMTRSPVAKGIGCQNSKRNRALQRRHAVTVLSSNCHAIGRVAATRRW